MVKILNNLVASFIDYPDNESICVCVVFMGCTHNCLGCQNPLFQNPDYDSGFTMSVTVDSLIKMLETECQRNETDKIVLSGGDPLSKYNIEFVKELLEKIGSKYDICIYTGHKIDYVKENNVKGFKYIKCGSFKQDMKRKSKKTDDEMILATPNQDFYDENYNKVSENGVLKFQDIF